MQLEAFGRAEHFNCIFYWHLEVEITVVTVTPSSLPVATSSINSTRAYLIVGAIVFYHLV